MAQSFQGHCIVKTLGLALTLTVCWMGSSSAVGEAAQSDGYLTSSSTYTALTSGNADATTHALLTPGQQGGAVKQLQQHLQTQGYSVGPIDGIFGPKTLQAVETFQQDQALTVDGIVGPDTWQRLAQVRLPLPSTVALFSQATDWIPTSFGQRPLLLPGQDRIPPSALWLVLMPIVPLLGGGYFYLNQRLKALMQKRKPPVEAMEARPKMLAPTAEEPPAKPASALTAPITSAPITSAPITSDKTTAVHPQPVVISSSLLWSNYFPLLGLLTASVVSFGVYIAVRTSLVAPSIEQLTRAADLKQSELDTWFDRQLRAVLTAAADPMTLADLKVLLQQSGDRDAQTAAYETINQHFQVFQAQESGQQGIALLSNGGIVVFSTDINRVGQYQPLQNTTTYFTADQIDRVEPNLYVSPLTNELLITLATPVVDETGQRLGVLAVDLNLTALDEQIRQPINLSEGDRSYLGDTGATYLVGRSSLVKSEFVSSRQDIDAKFRSGISSQGIDNAINRQDGAGLYLNYAKTPVIGVYRWANDQNLALLAEVNQAEVFHPARQLAQGIFWGGMAFTCLGSLLLWGIRHRAQQPQATVPSAPSASLEGTPAITDSDFSESLKQTDG